MTIESFHIATFNTENLLDPGIFFAGRDRQKDRAYTEEEYVAKVEWITRVLLDGKVDLVGFQEQFSERALNEVATRANLPYVYAPDLEKEKNIREVNGAREASGPFVALASKFPFESVESISQFPAKTQNLKLIADETGTVVTLPATRFQRPIIRAKVRMREGILATVFVAHLKSKRPQYISADEQKESARDSILSAMGYTRSLIIRATEAVALREIVLSEVVDSQTPVILFGDLNDDLAAVTTQIIAGEQPFVGLSNDKKRPIWDRLLYSVHDLEEAESYRDVSYSHIFDGRYELLDHIFVSEEFLARNPKNVATVRSTRMFNDHLIDARRSKFDGSGPSVRSDHGIPVTELWWRQS